MHLVPDHADGRCYKECYYQTLACRRHLQFHHIIRQQPIFMPVTTNAYDIYLFMLITHGVVWRWKKMFFLEKVMNVTTKSNVKTCLNHQTDNNKTNQFGHWHIWPFAHSWTFAHLDIRTFGRSHTWTFAPRHHNLASAMFWY